MAAVAAPAESEHIPLRNMDFKFDAAKLPRDWYRDDAFLTALVEALSLAFPEGEQFFVRSVKRYVSQIKDPTLQVEVTGFIGQEATHGREHTAANELIIARGGALARMAQGMFHGLLNFFRRTLTPRMQLAATAALEHFTAILAEQLLRTPVLRGDFHEEMRPLWLWHGLEETEHKAVAFTVFERTGGTYLMRCSIMLLSSIIFVAAIAVGQMLLFLSRPYALRRPWLVLSGLWRMWGYPGFFRLLVLPYLQYYRPGFTPNDVDTTQLVEEWRGKLFGDGGELVTKLKKVGYK